MKCVAIILARGGSKRIPRKNIKTFCGKPIISYSIEAALSSNIFDEVMVSTEDDEIAELVKSIGATVPFLRSKSAAQDKSSTAEAILDVLQSYSLIGKQFDYFCCIYPCAPFITAFKLTDSFHELISSGLPTIMPVVKYSYPVQRAFLVEDGRLRRLLPEYSNSRSQDLPPVYHDAGQFYWSNVQFFLENKGFGGDLDRLPYYTCELETQDIDTIVDWEIAEIKYKLWQSKLNS